MWNYYFCELIDLVVEIDDDLHSIGNVVYDALDDLRGDFPQLFEDDVVQVNVWEEIAQEPTKHDTNDTTDVR